MEFSRQEYWSGFPFPPAGDLPNPRIEPKAPILAGGFFTTGPPGKPSHTYIHTHKTQTGNWSPSESVMLDDMCFINIKVGKSMFVTVSESQVKSELHIGKNLGKQGTSSLRCVFRVPHQWSCRLIVQEIKCCTGLGSLTPVWTWEQGWEIGLDAQRAHGYRRNEIGIRNRLAQSLVFSHYNWVSLSSGALAAS